MVKKQFLLVTDNPDIGRPIQGYFENNQTTELHCEVSLSQALIHVMKGSYCLLMVDLQLSGIDRIEMIRVFNIAKHFPILALTEPLSSEEKVALLRAGVDAFIEKPISMEVCSAQADALVELYLKSDSEANKYNPITFGTSMMIAPRYRQAFIDGKPLDLARKEFDLLYFLPNILIKCSAEVNSIHRYGMIFLN